MLFAGVRYAMPVLFQIAHVGHSISGLRPSILPVNVSHLAPTPVGHRVRAEAEVVGIEGSQIRFTVAAWDDVEEIGRGTHERAVVDLSRVATRLERKHASMRN
jgi:acyl dehydratase